MSPDSYTVRIGKMKSVWGRLVNAISRWLAVVGFSFATLAHAQEIVTLPTRVGVRIS